MRRGIGLVAWSAVVFTSMWALHALGRGSLAVPWAPADLATWASSEDPATIVVATLRLAALALGWYLVGMTALAVALARTDLGSAVARLLPGAVGRAVRRACGPTASAAGLAIAVTPVLLSVAPSKAVAGNEPETATLEILGTAATETSGQVPPASGRGDDSPSGSPETATLAPLDVDPGTIVGAPIAPSRGASWAVRPGDHLWSIAAETLHDAWGRRATESEVTEYWAQVVSANRAALVDPSNPDLIYPGQLVELPPVPAQTGGV